MFQLPSLKLPAFLSRTSSSSTSHPAIPLPQVPIHAIETSPEKRARTLKHLLKANHANHAIIYHGLRWHNHAPHILGSAYLLGAGPEALGAVYEKESAELEGWRESPGEVGGEDWRAFLGGREYQRAFVDFFEDQLVRKRYDWKALLDEYLFEGDEPLIHGMVCGLAHPLIHLGYAYELDSRTVAIEALALGACFYSDLHKYLDEEKYTRPSEFTSGSLLGILDKVRQDKRFDGLYEHASGNIEKVFKEREDVFLEYWNAWDISTSSSSESLRSRFEDAQRTAVAVLAGTAASPKTSSFDFFFVHLLTSSHAVRILLPLIPARFHVSLLRQWWLFTLAVYIAQLRPAIMPSAISDYDVQGRGWKFVVHEALNSRHNMDAHFVKALRAMKVASETWGDDDEYYLKAAVKFADGFEHWAGFGVDADGGEYRYPEYQ